MGILTNRWVIGAVLFIVALIACGGASYRYGVNKVSLAWAEERIQLDKATTLALVHTNEQNKELAERLAILDVHVEAKEQVVSIQTLEVEKEVVKYVKEYVSGVCPPDVKRVRIKNQSIARTNEFAQTSIITDVPSVRAD